MDDWKEKRVENYFETVFKRSMQWKRKINDDLKGKTVEHHYAKQTYRN